MWMLVMDADTGVVIKNATFNYSYYNRGDGWYWVAVGFNALVQCNASGYNSLWFNTNGWTSVYVWLKKYTPPTTTYGNCWS